jgi:phosphatidylinositol alpha-1,6-mannosyltransferase
VSGSRRVLFLANDFPPVPGGIAGYLYGLVSHLDRHRTAVLAPAMPGAEAFDRTHDVRVYRRRFVLSLPFPVDKLARVVFPMVHLPSILQRERTDVLHCGHVLTAGVVGLLLHRRRGLPYVVYAYGADLLDYERHPRLARLMRRVLAHAAGVVTISDFSVGLLERIGVPRSRIAKVVMGIDVRRFRPDIDGRRVRERHRLGDRPVVLTVARLVTRKGHDLVIEALAKVRAAVPDAVYVIAGSGPDRERLERLAAERGLGDAVVFAGFVPDADLPEYYAAADCFVLASRQIGTDVEGAGNVTLEASASGRAVVAGRSGGTDEHVLEGETGYLVDPTDPGAIAARVAAILSDRALAERLGRRGRETVCDRFVWERTLAPLEPLL